MKPAWLIFGILHIMICVGSCRQERVHRNQQAVPSEPTLTAKNPLLRLLTPEECGIDFANRIEETYENNITTNINMYNGGGVAVGDFNNDDLVDIYFICSNGKNRLYQNAGGLKFRDITDAAGVGSEDGFETAATVVDINADGWLDLYVCRGGPEKGEVRRNRLFVNNGVGKDGVVTFTERAEEYGLGDLSACTGANFFDFDNDGDLDVYLLNYPTEGVYTNKVEARLGPDGKYHPLLHPRSEYDTDRLYRNDTPKGGGLVRFTDISKQAGVWNLGYGLSVSVTDFNRDGWIDVYVGNDFVQPDHVYINNGNGTFTDRIRDYFQHCTQHTMGTDLTDFDNDGWIDLVAADMLAAKNFRRKTMLGTGSQSNYTIMIQNGYFEPVVRNVLQRNNGNGTFSDIGCLAGIFQTDWSWSALLFDMDNDGWRDLYVTNGYRRELTDRDFRDFRLPEIAKKAAGRPLRDVFPDFEAFINMLPSFKVRNFCFQNRGDWTFTDRGGQWMTIPASWSCGAAWADLDNDGDLDLVVNNLEEPAFVYENLATNRPNSNFLQIKFQGQAPNTQGVGASVLIRYGGGKVQYAENFPTRGIFSSVEHLIHFGLGNTPKVDTLLVRWPDGKIQVLTEVKANQRLVLRQSDAKGYVAHLSPAIAAEPLFTSAPQNAGIRFTHLENEYNDFEAWPMNIWKVTELGPLVAVGDVNNDLLDDFFVGNAFDQPAALYVQQPNGTFRPFSTATWEQDKIYEDHGAIFFDADMDGDVDLFVVSGGAEATSPRAFQNRLYINIDGKGTFVHARGAVPLSSNAGLRAVAYDYDRDGDQDLFIGGRVEPAKWPLIPRSMVWRNERTHFADVTSQVAPDFERCGMVTDLTWVNLDSDPDLELVAVGEWMPVTVFKWKKGKLVNTTEEFGLNKSNGLWFRLGIADIDGDKDLDLITGNLGLNTRLTASAEGPLRCFARDFDNNGTLDPFVAYYEDGKLYPLLQKDVVTKHCPILKKKFLYAKDYGNATMSDLWPNLDEALQLYSYTLETCWWENQGGRFTRRTLPLQAQMAPVQGIIAKDFNNDGKIDLLLAGNKYGFEYETNRCDAGTGVLLLGDGKGNFTWQNPVQSGFFANREVRDLAFLRGPAGREFIVVANNNGPVQVFVKK
ncbi:MAG: VCBS repeat-containing protein [Saprospiraceae bacterium]|nr:VCBS repeat-containing protein [Saprospiraceae bacterium]MDW8484371.1 VCBS repeat-containing protein [Saprospiraceae bacterium]